MNGNWHRVLLMSLLVLVVGAPALLAQRYEVHPYGGFVWPNHTNVGAIKDQVIWGVKGGYFFDPSFELEGTFGYLNQFEVRRIDPQSRGWLWELSGDYNFSAKDWPVARQVTPFLVLGGGAIRTHLHDQDTLGFRANTGRFVNMNDGDSFFTVSYGGGIKSVRLWGPVGLRVEVRGRTLPNYYHSTPTWLEVTGGFNLMWGER
jgi:hypothetical protein